MDNSAPQQIKSIRVIKQVIRADGTREPEELAAYMDRDPAEMERVIREQNVKGLCDSGSAVLDILNSVPEETADRITAINERQADALRAERCA